MRESIRSIEKRRIVCIYLLSFFICLSIPFINCHYSSVVWCGEVYSVVVSFGWMKEV